MNAIKYLTDENFKFKSVYNHAMKFINCENIVKYNKNYYNKKSFQ